ncbi:MAG: carbohydrate kinase [Chloroflexi bacterium]|nr:carbohydrate kinase [Chloroflexota bacterium]
MTDQDIILSIDLGTQSARAMLIDSQGTIRAKSKIDVVPYIAPEPGWAEKDPLAYWDDLCMACHDLWAKTDIPKEAIAGVSLTTQRDTVINVDRQGKPVRPAIVWLDRRRSENVQPVGGWWGLLFLLSGTRETVAHLQKECPINWIKAYQPEVWAQTHKYLFLSGYITYRLVGRFVDSIGNQIGFVPFDFRRHQWARPSDWKWIAAPVEPEQLPELISPTEILGEITPEAAADTGIPVGLPLIAAAADKQAEVMGSGALAPHIGAISYGTTATINTTHTRYVEPIPRVPPYPSAVPGSYSLEIQVYRGYWMISWFKHEFGWVEQLMAEQQGVEAEKLLDDLLKEAPAGSMGLTLQPYWSPGLRLPGPEAKGAIVGWGDVHTRAHFYRAIIEGLAYALRDGKERTERRTGVQITELRAAGGGSQSDGVMQITADVFGLPVSRPHSYEAAGLGAAIDAAVGLGLHGDFASAVSEMTHIRDTFEPNMANHRLYNELYRGVYTKLYRQLKPLYESIRSITGYPPRD